MGLERSFAPGALFKLTAATVLCLATATGRAAEGGGSTYPLGIENFFTGAAPPPGAYLLAYGEYYTADKFKDNSGGDLPLPPDFKVKAGVVALRGIWITPYTVLGGSPLLELIVPLVDLRVTAGGQSVRKDQVGDVVVGAGLAFHHSPSLHSAVALDVTLPTASYSSTALANVGHNYLSWQPLYTVSLINPTGINADFKAVLSFNEKNHSTDYRSGNEFVADYSAGWGFGNGLVAGIGGYVRHQFEDDRFRGADVAGNRARAFAIGPSIGYNNGKGWLVTAKWQAETGVRNATQGSAFWVKTVVPF